MLETEKTRLKNKHNAREHLVLVLPESAAFFFTSILLLLETYSKVMQATARTTREVCA
jgi:hypothetical protein